jgi:sigma-E factor negative regulatory protein RseA
MSERLNESLSALMDGEAEELELRRILNHQDKQQIDDQWSRYHMVRAAIEQEPQLTNWDISARVSAAIADESAHTVSTSAEPAASKVGRLSWLRPVSGFAVAASVAAAVVVGVKSLEATSPTALPQALNNMPQLASSRAYPVAVGNQTGSVTASAGVRNPAALPQPSQQLLDAEAEKQLDKYLLRHSQQVSAGQAQGMIPYARVARFETE